MAKRSIPPTRVLLRAGAARAAGLAALLAAFSLAPVPAALAGPPAALAPAANRAADSFDDFASSWMQKMRLVEAEKRNAPRRRGELASYKSYSDFRVELRPTGYPRAPYVGILRYEERVHRCADAAARKCVVASVSPVTEIFRYQDGRWIY